MLSLERTAWSPRVLPNAVFFFFFFFLGGLKSTDKRPIQLSRLLVELRLRLLVPSSTCVFASSPSLQGLFSPPALNVDSGHLFASTGSAQGLSTVAQRVKMAVATTKL